MSLSPINSLMNMEMALYGGYGIGMSQAPSMLNGYKGRAYSDTTSAYNPTFNGYNNYTYQNPYALQDTTSFGQYIPNQYTYNQSPEYQTQSIDDGSNSIFTGLNQNDIDNLTNSYAKGLEPSESLAGAALGGAAFALVQNPRLIFHPINSFKGTQAVEKIFASAKAEGTMFNQLLKNPETNELAREFWFRANKVESRNFTKLGLFRRSYVNNPEAYKTLNGITRDTLARIESAATKEDAIKILEEGTTKLRAGYVSDGWLAEGFRYVKNGGKWVGKQGLGLVERINPNVVNWTRTNAKGETVNVWNKLTNAMKATSKPTVTDAITKGSKAMTKAGAEVAGMTAKKSFGKLLAKCGGVKGGLLFAGLEFIMSFGKIKTAFSKDSKTGWKQVGQTTVKAAGSAAGWALGEAAGLAIGTAICPGLGTIAGGLIGGAIGIIGGMIGCWAAGRGTKALVGEDVANKVEAEQLAQTEEGQAQLLQSAIMQVEKGKADPATQQTVQKLLALYA